jgi:pimeloyl-ACP methyl ester carboxylesterase
MNHSIADQVKKIETPITILASEDDPAITYDEIQNEVVANLKGARLVTTKGVGHLIPMESPEWLADQIRQAAVRKAD